MRSVLTATDIRAGAFAVHSITNAPLRLEGTFLFDAPPEEIWPRITDPNAIATWFTMITHGRMDHSKSSARGDWGEGSVRQCHTMGMGTLHETIKVYRPPHLVAYSARAWSMPIKNHLGVMMLERLPSDGTRLIWRQYFHYKGFVMRHVFPGMMITMMNRGMRLLQRDFGGPGGAMRKVA